MKWEQSVFSSNVVSIGYDEDNKDMIVTWKNGKRSAYNGVPESLALDVANAPSVGSMINSDIKPQYAHRYV